MYNIDNHIADIQIFTPTPNNTWQIWSKPTSKTMAYIIAIGGGNSGAGGESDVSGTYRLGGAGGGSAAFMSCYISLHFLPDVLYVLPGLGAEPAPPNTTGNLGNYSYVCVNRSIDLAARVAISGSSLGGIAQINAAGTAATAATAADITYGNCGLLSFNNGRAGATGGGGADGSSITVISTSQALPGGSGGGGSSVVDSFTQGGNQMGLEEVINTVFGGNVIHPNGFEGDKGKFPFSAGTGGAGDGIATGYNGGKGGYGCGGGGGGAGVTGGYGGAGGDGLVIIVCM